MEYGVRCDLVAGCLEARFCFTGLKPAEEGTRHN